MLPEPAQSPRAENEPAQSRRCAVRPARTAGMVVRADLSAGGRSIAWDSLWSRILEAVLANLENGTAPSSHNE